MVDKSVVEAWKQHLKAYEDAVATFGDKSDTHPSVVHLRWRIETLRRLIGEAEGCK